MAEQRTIDWYEVDQVIDGLETDIEHEIRVQREAIPLIFVPGIMGTRLRRSGTNGTGNGADGLPNMRWEPGKPGWMLKHFSGESPLHRKNMLVGPRFDDGFLEVDDSNPIGDGFHGIMEAYWQKFLNQLKARDWGSLDKIFEFPVYAVGYNWTDSSMESGRKLAERIVQIKDEAREITGLCEKVILITHSMGGIVSRSASELHGARDSILGIIHGVQPVTGAPAAYWRMKAGFEGGSLGSNIASRVLGNSGPSVTAILGNIPGGLQLLPNKLHRTARGAREWLTITESGAAKLQLPTTDPYAEIYRVPAVVKPKQGERPSSNKYWGLVDPDLLNPGHISGTPSGPPAATDNNALADAAAPNDWDEYIDLLSRAEAFHDALGMQAHPQSFCFRGVGHHTADVIELRIESNWVRSDPYPTRGFRGFFADAQGKDMQAVLQDPSGGGDGTVPVSSASAIDQRGKNRAFNVEHQPAYENGQAQQYTVGSVITLCKQRYDERRRKAGDYPVSSGKEGRAT